MNLRRMQSLSAAHNAGNTLVPGMPGGFMPMKVGKPREALGEPGDRQTPLTRTGRGEGLRPQIQQRSRWPIRSGGTLQSRPVARSEMQFQHGIPRFVRQECTVGLRWSLCGLRPGEKGRRKAIGRKSSPPTHPGMGQSSYGFLAYGSSSEPANPALCQSIRPVLHRSRRSEYRRATLRTSWLPVRVLPRAPLLDLKCQI